MAAKQYYNTTQVAEQLGITVGTLRRRWQNDPATQPEPARRGPGRGIYYTRAQIQALKQAFKAQETLS